VDRIINHLKLTFVAERPPPPQVAFQEYLVAAEAPPEYFSWFSLDMGEEACPSPDTFLA